MDLKWCTVSFTQHVWHPQLLQEIGWWSHLQYENMDCRGPKPFPDTQQFPLTTTIFTPNTEVVNTQRLWNCPFQEISNGRTRCFRTPKKPEYLIARSHLTERGPLGCGPIYFLMDPYLPRDPYLPARWNHLILPSNLLETLEWRTWSWISREWTWMDDGSGRDNSNKPPKNT